MVLPILFAGLFAPTVYVLSAESANDQRTFLATVAVKMNGAKEDKITDTLSDSARDADECIDKLNVLAGKVDQNSRVSVTLSCIDKNTHQVMLHVERGSRHSTPCDLPGLGCRSPVQLLAVN
jgi:hypothetical protein